MVASIVRHPSTSSNDFSFKTTWPISVEFHTQPPGNGEKKVYVFDPGHMAMMATMPTCGKNPKKSAPNHWASCLET